MRATKKAPLKCMWAMIVAVVLAMGLTPIGAWAAPVDTTLAAGKGLQTQAAADPIDVFVTISDKGTLAVARQQVTVTDENADGMITFDEAMAVAHEKYCPAGKDGFATNSSGWVTKFWGYETSGVTLYRNDASFDELVNARQIEQGDDLAADVLFDTTYWSDMHSYFDKKQVTVAAGEEFELALSALGWGDPEAAEGVQVGTWKDGTFTPIEGKVTGADGKVALSFDEAGTFVVSASGTVAENAYGQTNCPLSAPVCVVKVTAPADPIDVYVTVSNKGTLALVRQHVTVTDIDKNGFISLDEALFATHETYCPAGADGYATTDTEYGRQVTKLWGVETTANMFYKNDAMTNSVNLETVAAGDDIVAGVLTDSAAWSDCFGYFDKKEVSVKAGEEFTLVLNADSWGTAVDASGVQVGTWKDGAFAPLEGKVTGADGKVSLSFAEPGTYIVSANGTVKENAYGQTNCPLIAPVCVVKVTAKPLPTHTLTIKYVYSDGKQAKSPYAKAYAEGAAYDVPIPAITGYQATVNKVAASSVKGTMGKKDVTVTVTYTATVPSGKGVARSHRLAGDTALDTMSAIVDAGSFPKGGTVVLATSEGYWDALTAAGVAGMADAPVLMTSGSSLSPQTKAQIQKLKPKTIVICGGTAAVAKGVENTAKSVAGGAKIVRCAGQTATGTACEIFKNGKQFGAWSDVAFVCTNAGYWDALAAAPISYAKHMPIFLTEGASSISAETLGAMRAGGINRVFIVGGEAAITPAVKRQIEAAGIVVSGRLWGDTAIETSEEVAKFGIDSMKMSVDNLGVATSSGYWDALAGAALCGRKGSVLVLVDGPSAHSVTAFAKSKADSIADFYIFGGTAAVSKATENAVLKYAK